VKEATPRSYQDLVKTKLDSSERVAVKQKQPVRYRGSKKKKKHSATGKARLDQEFVGAS